MPLVSVAVEKKMPVFHYKSSKILVRVPLFRLSGDNSQLPKVCRIFYAFMYMDLQRVLITHKLLLFAGVVLLLGGAVLFLHHTQANSDLPANSTSGNNATIASSVSAPTDVAIRDAKRISDLKQIQGELELYFYACGYYPGTPHTTPPCGPYETNNTWAGLSAALIGSSLHVASVSNDPTTGESYFYSAAPHGVGYVIGAMLEDPTNPVLTQSVHGVVNKMNCDSPMYCVQL